MGTVDNHCQLAGIQGITQEEVLTRILCFTGCVTNMMVACKAKNLVRSLRKLLK